MPRRSIELPNTNPNTPSLLRYDRSGKASTLPLICERVRYYRLRAGIEQKVLAEALGITANSVSNWESGRSRPDVNHLPGICKILGISLYDLYGLPEPQGYSEAEKAMIAQYRKLSPMNRKLTEQMFDAMLSLQLTDSSPKLKKVLYFDRPLAAGIGDPTEFECLSEPIYLYDSEAFRRADYVFRVNGDSMEPLYSNGDLVLVERIPSGFSLNEGEIGAFIVGNEMYIKEYCKDGLHSINANYDVIRLSEDQAVYLIGKVLSVLNRESIASQNDIDRFRMLHE